MKTDRSKFNLFIKLSVLIVTDLSMLFSSCTPPNDGGGGGGTCCNNNPGCALEGPLAGGLQSASSLNKSEQDKINKEIAEYNNSIIQELIKDIPKDTVTYTTKSINTVNKLGVKSTGIIQSKKITTVVWNEDIESHILEGVRNLKITWYQTPKPLIKNASFIKNELIWASCKTHNATGKCSGQQTANVSTNESWSKQWGVQIQAGPKYPTADKSFSEIAGAVTGSYSQSYVTGQGDGSSISMKKEYAQAYIQVPTYLITGKFSGAVKITYRDVIDSDLVIYEDHEIYIYYDEGYKGALNWSGVKTNKNPQFAWSTWGNNLATTGCGR